MPGLFHGDNMICFESMSQVPLALFFFLPDFLFFLFSLKFLFQPFPFCEFGLFSGLPFKPFFLLLLSEQGLCLSTFFGQVGLVTLVVRVRKITN